jgi:hypothetical protein
VVCGCSSGGEVIKIAFHAKDAKVRAKSAKEFKPKNRKMSKRGTEEV